jgi:hypothetical protein
MTPAMMLDRAAQTGQSGQMGLVRTERTSEDMTATTEQDSRRQDCWGRTVRTGQPGNNVQNRIERTGQPGQNSQRRQLGSYIQCRKQRTRLPEQDSKDRTRGLDNCVSARKVGMGHLRKGHQDRSVRTGQFGQASLDRCT